MRTIALVFAAIALPVQAQDLPYVPGGPQAISLVTGEPLESPEPGRDVLDRLEMARLAYEADPNNVDKLIWYGRRLAYAGDYRYAIEVFSGGIDNWPGDARLYRHRGHRFISIREFDRAIADLEKAAALIDGSDNEIEPDGLPNALNIPVSSLHGNVWYHLGLAYYLKQDWDNAYRAFKRGYDAGRNDDNRVSTTHWLYMISRLRGDDAGAAVVLDPISADMNAIENMSYHRLCLFYKGELGEDELLEGGDESAAGSAVAYGVANWHYYNGDVETADRMLEALLTTPGWAAFGYIAAEVDLASR